MVLRSWVVGEVVTWPTLKANNSWSIWATTMKVSSIDSAWRQQSTDPITCTAAAISRLVSVDELDVLDDLYMYMKSLWYQCQHVKQQHWSVQWMFRSTIHGLTVSIMCTTFIIAIGMASLAWTWSSCLWMSIAHDLWYQKQYWLAHQIQEIIWHMLTFIILMQQRSLTWASWPKLG